MKTGGTKEKIIGGYSLDQPIGEGTFGKVRLATHVLTGEQVAVKVLEKDRISDVSDVERVAREIHILKIIRHPNLIQLYEIVETNRQLYIFTEYATGGELYEYIVSNKRIKEPEACRFFQQVISGVEYIHKLKVVHRDLKPENLLLDYARDIKIVDFGLSNMYKQDEKLKTACGSPCYAAPEMVAGKNYDGLKVDIWSSGVVLFALLCGYLPFEDPNTNHLYKKILNGNYTLPKFLSEDAKTMIKGILTVDPEKRFTIEDIRKHPWFSISPVKAKQGIIVGVHQIPSEPSILKQMEKYGFSIEYTQKCIEANKHNSATTTYYLLLQKFIREGGKSTADLSSTQFEPITIGRKLKNMREALQLSNTEARNWGTMNQVTPHLPIDKARSRKRVEQGETKKLEGTGGSSSKANEVVQNKELTNDSLHISSPKAHEYKRRKTPVAYSENMDNLLGSRLQDYIQDLSLNNAEEQKRTLNATAPLKNKLKLPSKEERIPNHKLLSTRAQAMVGTRPFNKKAILEMNLSPFNASITPSAGIRELVQFSPKPNNFFAFTKTYRSNSKRYNSKTPKMSR
jgi:5'-AMP-activated protein kinase catalytic alpha subunit